ncbi:unnamed protein product [Brachionus calyciflorus]|uniref:Purinergic receptor n=1 Tax=Brachionus calyciflorus TaxID=104777 RepID=A0A814BLV7_9BILA|nr:unnamed protein product [Brachionus calyciflorus]
MVTLNSVQAGLKIGSKAALNAVFSYSTVREAKIHSLKVAILFRLFQLVIIGYIIGWSIIYNKGYQEFDQVSSTVTTKVKGLGYTYTDDGDKEIRYLNGKLRIKTNTIDDYRVFDTADYVIPPSEYNSIFVMTNFVETRQSQDLCDEDYTKVDCLCEQDEDCMNHLSVNNAWNGIPTGRCIESSINSTFKVCEISTWCPVEREINNNQKNLIQNIQNFTIFIKNDVTFQLFNRKLRNILPNMTNDVISHCIYDSIKDPYCPIFLVGNILEEAEPDLSERIQMLSRGGVILVSINWDCNLDSDRLCFPKFKFSRFDLQFSQASAASGFNFRFSDKFEVNGTLYRILVKAYGLRFVINVSGKAGKFNFVPLLITIGAGLGLLSVATIVADFFLLYLTSKKNFYRELKELDSRNKVNLVASTSNMNKNPSFTDLTQD